MGASRHFLPHVGGARKELTAFGAGLDVLLDSLWEAARSAWPDIELPRGTFLRTLAEKTPDINPIEFLNRVHASDLFLTRACVAGDKTALGVLEKRYLAKLSAPHAGRGRDSAFADDLKQSLSLRLLAAQPGEIPKISIYSGQASLGVWLRTLAANLAIDLQKKFQRERPMGDQEIEIRAPGPDPEIEYLKKIYGKELQAAFLATLPSLPARERNFLQLHYLEGMPFETIAQLFRVSHRTVRRSLSSARQNIFDQTRRILAARLNVPKAELDTLMGLVQSQLQINLKEFAKLSNKSAK